MGGFNIFSNNFTQTMAGVTYAPIVPLEKREDVMIEQTKKSKQRVLLSATEELLSNPAIDVITFEGEFKKMYETFINLPTKQGYPTYTVHGWNVVALRKGTRLYRAVQNESYIWAPPAEKVRMGRMNKENESVFYVSFNKETAIAEKGNESGLYINEYILKKDIDVSLSKLDKLIDSGKCTGKSNRVLKNFINLRNTLFAIESKPDDELYNLKLYTMTNYLRRLYSSKETSQGIIYPSVKMFMTGRSLYVENQPHELSNLCLFNTDGIEFVKQSRY